jgi:cell division ATPase FtsA
MGNCISQSFASAYAISQLEKSAAFVFDIGEGSTDMAIISYGHFSYVSSFFYAGMHLVNDLSAVLGLSSFDSRSLIVNGEIDVQSENEKSVIVRERMLEILNTCMEELHGAHFERDIRPCVYICGGVSKLTGVEKLIENTLKTKCVKPKINWPDGWLESFQDERYVSTLGAMLYFSRNAADGEKRRLSFSSIAQSIKDWLENNF